MTVRVTDPDGTFAERSFTISVAAVPNEPPAFAPIAKLAAEQEVFLDTLQARTFRWFWETTDPETERRARNRGGTAPPP